MSNKHMVIKEIARDIVAKVSRRWFLILSVIVAIGFIMLLLSVWGLKRSQIGITHTDKIDITPVQIERIRDIGQWEFLAISDEELVDTVRHGFFGDDELARIYYGTLRLGIDLQETSEGWIKMDKDTVVVMLPPIKLLDEKFIDEARTKTFYEDGRWSEADKALLLERAKVAMKTRCLTPANRRSAAQNASAQFSMLLRSMGFEYSRIRFHEQER